ncbi:MAG: glycoside hydrolase family 3 C-terminal domain-containing protein [Bifidobacteriaceae bacterium]|jgi:beta-glucosidase|nr:glycoside hydrolase family 3 C-terminal domain-containing protein [Bifidobacteriaceae bacterium]
MKDFEDKTLSAEKRVEDLLPRMSLEEKAGMLFQNMFGCGPVDKPFSQFNLPPVKEQIENLKMNHFNLIGSLDTAKDMAKVYNDAQEIAASVGQGIPLSVSTDPRNGVSDNPLAAMLSGPFSQWPEPLGFAALRDPERIKQFGNMIRQEYNAVGIRVALHPQIDLSTEYRWPRINGTYGEDANLTSKLGVAYIQGLQTNDFGYESVSAMAKHFPGGGAQGNDGEDSHFAYGKDQIYPGENWNYHLEPFKAVIKAGVRQMMPYYGRPIGTHMEEVGFGFNKGVLTDLLRKELGFTGIICTDWGLVTDAEVFGKPFPARAWGAENLTEEERVLKILDAGADQFGGESRPDLIIKLVKDGKLDEKRVDISVYRLLMEKFLLGLFDEKRFVDIDQANSLVKTAEIEAASYKAQSESVTVLKNEEFLPLKKGINVYLEGMNEEAVRSSEFAKVVDVPEKADVAILRVVGPYDHNREGFDAFFHAGSLEFSSEEIAHIKDISSKVPTVVDMYTERPAVLTNVIDYPSAWTLTYGTSDKALLDVYFGDVKPLGKIPFDLPRSQKAVEESRADMQFDTDNPLFKFGYGLIYP